MPTGYLKTRYPHLGEYFGNAVWLGAGLFLVLFMGVRICRELDFTGEQQPLESRVDDPILKKYFSLEDPSSQAQQAYTPKKPYLPDLK